MKSYALRLITIVIKKNSRSVLYSVQTIKKNKRIKKTSSN